MEPGVVGVHERLGPGTPRHPADASVDGTLRDDSRTRQEFFSLTGNNN